MAIFLKLGDIKGESLDHKHQETLLRIDGDFLKLASANPDGSLKIDGQIKHDIAVISDSFLKLGQDFIKLSDVAIKIDDLFLKLDPTNFHIKLDPILDSVGGAVVDGGPPNPQADFLKLDTALKIAGADLGGFAGLRSDDAALGDDSGFADLLGVGELVCHDVPVCWIGFA